MRVGHRLRRLWATHRAAPRTAEQSADATIHAQCSMQQHVRIDKLLFSRAWDVQRWWTW